MGRLGTSTRRVGQAMIGALGIVSLGCRDASGPASSSSAAVTESRAEGDAVTQAFTAQDLGILPGRITSAAYAINANGDVAGSSGNPVGGPTAARAVMWIGGSIVDLGVPFGTLAEAQGINDNGTVVGYGYDTGASQLTHQGIIWKSGVTTLISSPGSRYVRAYAVNNNEEVVGHFEYPPTGLGHAYRYTAATGLVDIHPPSGYSQSFARGISETGEVAGYATTNAGEIHAMKWSSSNVPTDLGTLGGPFPNARGYGINTAGAVVGQSTTDGGAVPFLWKASTGMVGVRFKGAANDISDAGRIVGWSGSGIGSTAGTSKGGVHTSLPELPGWLSSVASGVNRCGSAAGTAQLNSGASRAVRWQISSCD